MEQIVKGVEKTLKTKQNKATKLFGEIYDIGDRKEEEKDKIRRGFWEISSDKIKIQLEKDLLRDLIRVYMNQITKFKGLPDREYEIKFQNFFTKVNDMETEYLLRDYDNILAKINKIYAGDRFHYLRDTYNEFLCELDKDFNNLIKNNSYSKNKKTTINGKQKTTIRRRINYKLFYRNYIEAIIRLKDKYNKLPNQKQISKFTNYSETAISRLLNDKTHLTAISLLAIDVKNRKQKLPNFSTLNAEQDDTLEELLEYLSRFKGDIVRN